MGGVGVKKPEYEEDFWWVDGIERPVLRLWLRPRAGCPPRTPLATGGIEDVDIIHHIRGYLGRWVSGPFRGKPVDRASYMIPNGEFGSKIRIRYVEIA